MKTMRVFVTTLLFIPMLGLTSCESPTGKGAIAGAAGGAALGALLGNGKGNNIAAGALLGAGTGALIGHLVGQADDRGYYEGRQIPYGESLGRGLVRSPYRPYNVIDTRGIPHGAVVEDPTTGGRFIKP